MKSTEPLVETVSYHDIHHYAAIYVMFVVIIVGVAGFACRRRCRRRSAKAAIAAAGAAGAEAPERPRPLPAPAPWPNTSAQCSDSVMGNQCSVRVGETPYKVLQDTLLAVWDGLQSDSDSDKNGEVSSDEWISSWDSYAQNPSDVGSWQNLYAKFIFQLEDASSDGSIDSDEFSDVYASFGSDKGEAVTAFRKMAKGKANVSWDEFQVLWKEYFTSDDVNAPGNFIFGKTSF